MRKLEKLLFRKVEVWLLLLIVVVLFGAMIVFGWMVQHAANGGQRFGSLPKAALTIAQTPTTLKNAIKGEIVFDDHRVVDRFEEPAGFTILSTPADPQYILVSRYDGDIGWSVIELYREGEASPLHRWVFNDAEALEFESANPIFSGRPHGPPYTIRMIHPWLSEDGTLTVHAVDGGLYRFDACANPIWVNADYLHHHSLEGGMDGTFWTIGATRTTIKGQGWDHNLRDDHVLLISADGELLYAKSVLSMLQKAGLLNLIYDYDKYQIDPIHLNDVQPVEKDGPNWRRGDIFLSIGHLNMILLYRPSTDEVIWFSQDRIMHQHDVDIIGESRISVFDNRRKTGADGKMMVVGPTEIVAFDLPSKKAKPLYTASLAAADVRAYNQGLIDELPGVGYMIEETNQGRLLKFGEDQALEWVFINKDSRGATWTMNWSRYIDKEFGDRAAKALKDVTC